ncbi:nuclear transport factor 2 family protein [Cesiribacter sp. SM1]|uniref:nuclear transport factor 2 family protein n=1 Tax=Cesiribacter sp. SM1 TaxID=2861196 RepID=UPI001CD61AA2|nr:nuclear transport factor 2 family protein [Cesiribacter sp. SM1]
MKKTLIFLFLLCLGLGAAAQQSAEQEVLALERQWLDAYEQNDAAAMDRIVAEGFEIRFPQGNVQNKAALVKMVRDHAGKPGTTKLYTVQTVATAYPGTVILRGIVVSEFMVGAEKRQVKQYYTDTWVRTEKGWQVAASHLTDLPKPGAAQKAESSTAGAVKKEG